MNNDELEKAIEDQPYEKVTKKIIDDKICEVGYLILPNSTVTICSITMINGFHVIGKSACVDSGNFKRELGEQLAFKDAYRQLWSLEGYLLAESRMDVATPESD